MNSDHCGGDEDEGELREAGVAPDPPGPHLRGEGAPGEDHLQLSDKLCGPEEIPPLRNSEEDKI